MNDDTVLIVTDVPGVSSSYEAFRQTQDEIERRTSTAWLLSRDHLEFLRPRFCFVRDPVTGGGSIQHIGPEHIPDNRPLSRSSVGFLSALERAVARRTPAFRNSSLWQKVTLAISTYRSAVTTSMFHERYLQLWTALETALSNLAIDTSNYERAVPIGTRVAYRAALLLGAPKSSRGKIRGEDRWAQTIELQTLYFLRNKTVHEGDRNPPVDEVALRTLEKTVYAVLMRIAYLALWYDLTRVEQLLAWVDAKYPDTGVIS